MTLWWSVRTEDDAVDDACASAAGARRPGRRGRRWGWRRSRSRPCLLARRRGASGRRCRSGRLPPPSQRKMQRSALPFGGAAASAGGVDSRRQSGRSGGAEEVAACQGRFGIGRAPSSLRRRTVAEVARLPPGFRRLGGSLATSATPSRTRSHIATGSHGTNTNSGELHSAQITSSAAPPRSARRCVGGSPARTAFSSSLCSLRRLGPQVVGPRHVWRRHPTIAPRSGRPCVRCSPRRSTSASNRFSSAVGGRDRIRR